MVDFGSTLKALRIQNNITQAQLAQQLGLTKAVISAYETGLHMPSYDVLITIAKIFKVTTDYLLGVEKKQEVDFSGLTEEEITALLNLIKAMKRRTYLYHF
ncbi:MAG: helix-turn-helix transcriptional regulator [Lachnospiraceae bacterium]|nr:helix-turn-helix transcriptional regulator [Lachnospiraceae bacterium]